MGASLPRQDRELAVDVTAKLLAGAIARDGNSILEYNVIQENIDRLSGVAVQVIKAVDRHMAPSERTKAKQGKR